MTSPITTAPVVPTPPEFTRYELMRLRDTTIARWTDVAVSTAPIDETVARDAATQVAMELSGRPPRAVLIFASPRQARVAGLHLKAALLAGGTHENIERQLRARLLNQLERTSAHTSSFRTASSIHTAVFSASRAALSLSVPMAVEPSPRQPVSMTEATAALRSLTVQLNAISGDERRALTRTRPVVSLSRNIDLGFRHQMQTWLGFAAAHDYVIARDPTSAATDPDTALASAVAQLCANAGSFWIYSDVIVICQRPERLHLDPQGRAHHSDGPAIVYRDGFSVYASRGTHIPARVYTAPMEITVADIDKETSPEVRRVMLAKMGVERYLAHAEAEKIDEDETGILWRRQRTERFRIGGWRDEISRARTLCFVEVINGTPEPDGTFKHYYLRVPPNMQTAREAVAWTYGLSADDYHPERRT
jgi:hypothetical protein